MNNSELPKLNHLEETVEEIAYAITYLASPSASSTTGTCFSVDGGMDSIHERPRQPPRKRGDEKVSNWQGYLLNPGVESK